MTEAGDYVRISSNIESGISPLEVTLKIDGSFSIENSSMGVSGPTILFNINWEDKDPRWLNHFYDPTTGKGLNTAAGLVIYGDPSLQWGKSSLNDWNWQHARDYFYSAVNPIYASSASYDYNKPGLTAGVFSRALKGPVP